MALVAIGITTTISIRLKVDHRRLDIAGANGIDANAAGRQFEGQGLGQQIDTTLGSAIDRRALIADDASIGADIDDLAAGLLQKGDGETTGKESALEIDIDDTIPISFCHSVGVTFDPNSGRIDEQIEAATARHRLVDHDLAITDLADIASEPERAIADLGGGSFGTLKGQIC